MKRLREERRSSPDVKEWHQFWKELCAHGTGENPPAPLILAANASSAESKWQRLADQLDWAAENGALPWAIDWLSRLPSNMWQSSSAERWSQSGYEWNEP